MSTGADPKSMPGTPGYRDNYDRVFGADHRPQRGVFVSRCSSCDGVTFEPGARLYDCGKCGGKDCRGSVDIHVAPPPKQENALSAPVMAGRFYENAFVDTVDEHGNPVKVDIGSRERHKEYQRRTGTTTLDDYATVNGKEMKLGTEWARAAKEREAVRRGEHDRAARREEIGRQAYEWEKKHARR